MKKTAIPLIVLMQLAAILTAGETRTVRDMAGFDVRIPASPNRILSLSSAATNAIVSLGQTGRLAAVDEHGAKMPGAEKARVIAKGAAIAKEIVLASRIDCAFIWWYQDDLADVLKELGVPVLRIKNIRACDLPFLVIFVADVTVAKEAGEKTAREIQAFLDAPPPAPSASVYIESYDAFKTCGSGTYADDLLRLAGLRNIASDRAGSFLVSSERIIQAAPEVILCVKGFSSPARIMERPGFASLDAVRNNMIFQLDQETLAPSPEIRSQVAAIKNAVKNQNK